MSAGPPLLEVEGLRVRFHTDDGPVDAVRGASLSVPAGGALGLVGASGAGKSVTMLAVLGLAPGGRTEVSGTVRLDGRDLLGLSREELRAVRGAEIAMAFQDGLSSLHPQLPVGRQIAEAVRAHRPVSRAAARARAVELLELVGLPEPARRSGAYPHELSGGMRQRALLAIALAGEPRLLIADEPTSALDTVVQAEILALLARLRRELETALVLVSHDLAVVTRVCDEIAVMDAGRIVERGPREDFAPQLTPSRPPRRRDVTGADREPVLEVERVVKRFDGARAVDEASLTVAAGEAVGLVGGTGAGKSTLARVALRLLDPTAGTVRWAGRDVTRAGARALRPLRRDVQIVFQDPSGSLNPRRTVGAIVADGLELHQPGRDRRTAVEEALERVGLEPAHHNRFPHELSGGQLQRVGVARALAVGPRVLVADEPVSALDASMRDQVLDLLDRLRHELGLALLLIAHDLGVVRRMCDRVAVMDAGRIVEVAGAEELFAAPRHDATRTLLQALPSSAGASSP